MNNDKPASDSAAALSEEDRKRIDADNPYTNLNYGRKVAWPEGAEYATKYERERQAAELDKLRTENANLKAEIEENKWMNSK